VSVPRVSVIIVAYNSGAFLARCIAHLAAQDFTDFEAIIFDNASTDNAVDTLDLPDARFRIVRSEQNLGFAGANNAAAREARGVYLVLLNPDAFAAPTWLSALLAAAERTRAVMVGSLQLMADDPTRIDGAGDCYHVLGIAWRGGYRRRRGALKSGSVFAPCAAAALYERAAFSAVGGFDERFFCYFEDVDLAFRLRIAGARAYQCQEAVVHHVGSGTLGVDSDFAVFHGSRNRIWCFVKNMPPLRLALFAPMHAALSLVLLALSIGRPRFWPMLRGMRAGLAGVAAMWRSRRAVRASQAVSVDYAFTYSICKLALRLTDVRHWGNRSGLEVHPPLTL